MTTLISILMGAGMGILIGLITSYQKENRNILRGIESRLSDLQDRLTDR